MTREELEILIERIFVTVQDQIEDVSKFDIEFGLACFKQGIRYGFEKARELTITLKPQYESPEQVIEELDKEQPK